MQNAEAQFIQHLRRDAMHSHTRTESVSSISYLAQQFRKLERFSYVLSVHL